ncbi:MAG: transposase [bacterium]
MRSTNAIERAFREIRRRTRPMTCFTNLASCDRIIYAVIHAFQPQTGGTTSFMGNYTELLTLPPPPETAR